MKLGQIELGKNITTVGSLTGDINAHQDLEKIDVFELRIDLFENLEIESILKIIRSLNLKFRKPSIATIRSNGEGSPQKIDDEKRYEIFKNVIPLVEAVDIELSSDKLAKRIIPLCKENNVLLISSYHNLETTPEVSELEEIVSRSKEISADIVKIAVKANDKDDLDNLIKFTSENKGNNLVTISLGSIGLISRIVNPLLGSLMTYGYIDQCTAIGQISIFEIIEELRLYDPEYNQHLIKNAKLLESV